MSKVIANEIVGVFERLQNNQCTRDRALEDVSKIIEKFADERPIVGYVKSGAIRHIFYEILKSKKQNQDKSFLFDCSIHRQEIETIERIQKSL